MIAKPFVRVIASVALIGVFLAGALLIPTKKAPAQTGPGVARVSLVEGSAVVQRGESRTQTNAVRNAPLLPGDYISTGKTSRAEVQFDGYTAVRFGGNAQARITSNDRDNRKMQLADGTIEVGMVRDAEMMQIDTPSVTIQARQAGDYRISIASDGSSWITARSGSVDVVTPQRTYTLRAGSALVARGSASHPEITDASAVGFDSFDAFNAERDKTMIAAQNASPNLNPQIAGYDNLGAYGRWQAVAGYGQSWVPNEPAGWVPYRNGSWAWEGGYGWTWIGSEPWGWAPYHYGNWYSCRCGASGWAWLPPSGSATPAWSPALVGFFGFDVADSGAGPNNCGGNYGYAPSSSNYSGGPSGNAPPPAQSGPNGAAAPYGEGGPGPSNEGGPTPYGEGGPGPGYPAAAPYGAYPYPYIGWVPIAPYEPYYPWYPGWAWLGFGWGVPFFGGYGYPGFATRIVNVTNITNVYRNFRHGGATATRMRNFRHGTVYGHTVAVTGRDLGRHVGTIHGALPVRPTRANLAFSHGTVHAPVKFSKAFDSPRFASDKALAQALHGGVTGHGTGHAAAGRANAPVSHARATLAHANEHPSMSRESASSPHQYEATRHENAPVARENSAPSRQFEAARHENAPMTRENMAPARQAEAPRRENSAPVTAAEMRSHGAMQPAPRQAEDMHAAAPSTSWGRFNDARAEGRSDEFSGASARSGSAMNGREAEGSAESGAGREGRAPSDVWGRFSDSRGESYGGGRNAYAGGRDPYAGRDSTPSYSRESPSYSRGSYGSPYSRESYPSYSRGSYDSPYSRGSYPSYSHGSYPSYSHESYPSYSHESYPSYSRGSYPSYSHGSYGSAPAYSRGYSAPRSSGGGGGGGGGDRRGGGGRPPH
jgi:FecR protein